MSHSPLMHCYYCPPLRSLKSECNKFQEERTDNLHSTQTLVQIQKGDREFVSLIVDPNDYLA
jgi:hypothetical protein